ncbi:RHS repeat-associated core domain-containing protein [Peterkaempfera bronchialis]|uniref:RHS repeat-associated core domain-containing protein n=1 Tax=Peterkaempfera bronchialis TaxID=2126346 RepID=UPI003C30B363
MVRQVTNNGATTTTYTVDAASRTTATTLDPANLARTTKVSYDPDDHVVMSVHTGASGTPETTTATYDALGNPVSTTVHDGSTAPVGRWKLGETGGAEAADSSGSHRTATVNGGVTWSTDHGGSAAFNGTDAAISTDGPVVDTTGSFTVSAWVKVNGTAHNYTAVAQDASWHSGFYLGYASSQNSYGTGKATRSLGYDALHRLTSDVLTNPGGSTEASISYGYDLNDNETSKTTTGVVGAAAHTYTYDWADRLTSWNNGTATTGYSYDASGNRTRVGGDTYTYDARNELTSDGHNSYAYTPRGTLRTTTSELGSATTTAADAFNRVISQGGQSYAYDGLDRVVTAGTGLDQQTFSYTGVGNDLASDGGASYGRDPEGGLVGVRTGGVAVLAMTDLHDDVVAQFTDSGAALTGSTTYDPFGKVTATSGMLGHLGYQSEWTDPDTNQVDMAARWYNPSIGQFTSRDTVGLNPVPASVHADRFAYADDNPLTGTDPTGHWSLMGSLKSAAHTVTHAASSAYHATVSYATSYATATYYDAVNFARQEYHAAKQVAKKVVKKAVHTAKHVAKKAVRRINDARVYVVHHVQHVYHRARQVAHHAVARVKHIAHAAVRTVKHGAKAVARTVKKAGKAVVKFAKKHPVLASTVVGLATYAACAAATGGAGVVACGAVAGAASSAISYALAPGKHTLGGLATAAVEGAAIGLAGGAVGGAVDGAISAGVQTAVKSALGQGVVSSVVSGAVRGAVGGAAGGAAANATDYSLNCAGGAECSAGGAVKAIASGAATGAAMGGVLGAAGGLGKRAGCGGPHSFSAATPVLLAAGHTKPISQIQVGDLIFNAAPGNKKNETHHVDAVIVTKADHDFVDVTIATESGPKTIQTTRHHQFYDATTDTWTQAADLKPHHKLQNASSTTTEILNVHPYTATRTTYDLTIDGLHTYYVLAGSTPILVHNTDGPSNLCTISGHGHVQSRVDDLTDSAGAGAGFRTMGGLHADVPGANGGLDFYAVGARADMTPAQFGELPDLGHTEFGFRVPQPAKLVTRDNLWHAEVKLFNEVAGGLQLQPRFMVVSRPICPACEDFLTRRGATLTSATTAEW